MASRYPKIFYSFPVPLVRTIRQVDTYFPIQSINLIDNQLVKSFVVQIWFRKNGYHLSLNRTEFESESTNANIGKNLQTVKESGQALSER